MNGKLVQMAVFAKPLELTLEDMHGMLFKSARLIWCFGIDPAWATERLDASQWAMNLLKTGKVKGKTVISHEFPLERAKDAYEMQLNKDESILVSIKPG